MNNLERSGGLQKGKDKISEFREKVRLYKGFILDLLGKDGGKALTSKELAAHFRLNEDEYFGVLLRAIDELNGSVQTRNRILGVARKKSINEDGEIRYEYYYYRIKDEEALRNKGLLGEKITIFTKVSKLDI